MKRETACSSIDGSFLCFPSTFFMYSYFVNLEEGLGRAHGVVLRRYLNGRSESQSLAKLLMNHILFLAYSFDLLIKSSLKSFHDQILSIENIDSKKDEVIQS
ncbi:hypothetical protein VNO80_20931 [Phaseolus coccineus]|uniref:Uncharacterized protein n=1 Tax=Phaseolus coccineus TaxID=3886 RepID=A0AAN9QSL0_PHACN